MSARLLRQLLAFLLVASFGLLLALWVLSGPEPWGRAAVRPNLEDRRPDGAPHAASTQSLIRGHHWLDSVEEVDIQVDRRGCGSFELMGDEPHDLRVRELPMAQLVPRLHYRPASPPDAFDAFNLLLAEFSRNGLSVAYGEPGTSAPHFETSLSETHPWTLEGDYDFRANPRVRPLRCSVVNNCLNPGLWELNAVDRSGEIYHGWFEFPRERYDALVAETNRLSEDFTREALEWRTEAVAVRLDRLRSVREELGATELSLAADGPIGFSSQGSRRKLSRRFALVGQADDLHLPQLRSELTAQPVHLSNFVPPGKYSLQDRREFDLRFLGSPVRAYVRRVLPLSDYRLPAAEHVPARPLSEAYLELELDLGARRIIIGNLPVELLVPQADFSLHGFGVGILSASGLAERRQFLIDGGPAPSFAYLLEDGPSGSLALNSHEYGLEQIFIRTHSGDAQPWWEITITSFERIVDLVKYRVAIPPALHEELHQATRRYVSPLYLTYRDDNLR